MARGVAPRQFQPQSSQETALTTIQIFAFRWIFPAKPHLVDNIAPSFPLPLPIWSVFVSLLLSLEKNGRSWFPFSRPIPYTDGNAVMSVI